MNECSKSAICGVGGQCVNLPGSYKCECHSGFRSKSQRHPACEGTNTLICYDIVDVSARAFPTLCVCDRNMLACLGLFVVKMQILVCETTSHPFQT